MSGNRSEPEENRFKCIWMCGVCISVCPEDAISHRSDVFIIDSMLCSGCLMCSRTCPAGIIREDLFA